MTDRAARDPDLPSAFRWTALSTREVWLRYLALGGKADEVWVELTLLGVVRLAPGEYNVLAQALNERLDELPERERGPKLALDPLGAGHPARRRP